MMSKTGKGSSKAVIGLLAIAAAFSVHAQGYPDKPVRMIVGYAVGGGTDLSARLLGTRLAAELGQPFVVENRTGATGTIAAQYVANSEPDGYRLLMTTGGTFNYSVLRTKGAYDFEREFTPISRVATFPMVLIVHSSVPARNVTELIELARRKPGGLTFASDGIGGTLHLGTELFSSMANVKLTHVPFKGSAEGVAALAGGQIDMMLPSISAALPLLNSGKFRALAVTGAKRSTLLPDVPTIAESGVPGFDYVGWGGIVGPARLPQTIVDKLDSAIRKVAAQPELKEAFAKQGLELESTSPTEFSAYLRKSTAEISPLARQLDLKLE